MSKMMAKLQRFGRISRQLHTIISQETIKPSSPTPPHLKIHNLSLLDQFAPNIHMPFIFFYPNYGNGDTNILKQSLSKCLSKYYPFAGRFPTPSSPNYINCTDEGVEFLEASKDRVLEDFIQKNVQDESLDQLFPNGLGCTIDNITGPNLVVVQLNHFSGGGAAVAVSIAHKVADGSTIANFINHWSNVTRCRSPINPCFIPSSTSHITMPEITLKNADKVKPVTREFVFPNSKLNELKNKVMAMGTVPKNPTRVEILTSLIFKHAVNAAVIESGSFEKSNLFFITNMRNKLIENYPKTTVGNLFTLGQAKMANYSGEIRLNEVIAEIRKGKTELEGLSDVIEVGGTMAKALSALYGDGSTRAYKCSSLCRFPFYEVDFGWGKPVEVTMRIPNMVTDFLMLIDTPSGDGIKALVRLPGDEIPGFESRQVSIRGGHGGSPAMTPGYEATTSWSPTD